ncbi:ribosomal RNA small subunit methyltransferase G [Moorella thermoacetica]|uniref:Ribosomal RNA small subunit methyltransferase G n=1 Tax=Neomoorella thermoacetica TaxID=1525 RepID=A0A1J5P5E8_NEOTH|nr:ribosomal RNA small subunit methyltransferase G [Moorella thermoacetica]
MRDRDRLLAAFSKDTGITLKPEQVAMIEAYAGLLRDYNQKVNLTAITDREEIWRKHVLDSLLLFLALEIPAAAKVIDIGTGAGIPGLILKIYRPDLEITLLESQGKKVEFLKKTVATLGLEGIECLWGRAEEAGRQKGYRESFDLAVSRGLAGMNTLVEYCLPFVRVGGFMIAYKGPGGERELNAAARAIAILGGRTKKVWRGSLTGGQEARQLIIIQKEHPTPPVYPRRPGLPAKRPLQ